MAALELPVVTAVSQKFYEYLSSIVTETDRPISVTAAFRWIMVVAGADKPAEFTSHDKSVGLSVLSTSAVPPGTRCWVGAVIGCGRVSSNDSVYKLGKHSLMSTDDPIGAYKMNRSCSYRSGKDKNKLSARVILHRRTVYALKCASGRVKTELERL